MITNSIVEQVGRLKTPNPRARTFDVVRVRKRQQQVRAVVAE